MKLKKICLCLLIMLFFCGIYGKAQKKVVSVPTPPPYVEDSGLTKKKPVKKEKAQVDYVTLIEIDENSRVRITIQSPANSADFAESLFSALNQKIAPKKLNSTEIVVKPDSALKFGEIVNLIKKIRQSPTQNINVEINENLLVVIPKPLPKTSRPNPLLLLVRMEKGGKIWLNNEEQGSINDLSGLVIFLNRIFKERTETGVFRVGSNEVEASVFVKAPLSVSFSDVIKIAEALRESGAFPIVLQIDDLQP